MVCHFLLQEIFLTQVSNHVSSIGRQIIYYWATRKARLLTIVIVIMKSLSRVRLVATPWTVANQAPPSMGFSRQEYWSGLPFPSPGDLPDPGIEPGSPALWADALPSEPPGKSQYHLLINYFEKIFLNITLHKNFRIFLPTDFCFFFFWKDTAVQFLFQRKYFWFIFIILRFPMSDYRF